jgi:hypothetical protein
MSYAGMTLMGLLVVLLGCRAAPPPRTTNLPPCGSAATPECNGRCPYPGQTCYLRAGFPTCTCL